MEKDPFKLNFDSLDEFADFVSEVLQCPITIEDANHRLIAYSTHDERTDPARISTIIGRRVPEKVINNLWIEGVIPALLKSREPIRVKTLDKIGLGRRVAVSIWQKEEVLGFIWALEVEKPLNEKDLVLLKQAADAAKNKLLQHQARKNKKEEHFQEFFWKLLTGHFQSNKEIMDNFHNFQIPPASSFAVTVLQFEEDIINEEEKQASYLLQTNQSLKIALYTINHQYLILLISLHQIEQPLNKLNDFAETFVQKMEERFGVKSIKPAYSSIYSDYQKVEKAYREARTVLSMKEKFPSEIKEIHGYQNLGIYQFIDVLLEKRTNDDYENHALKKLLEYDDKHNSNLIESLDVFLNKDNNVKEAAKALNVHMNTLNYRLKRISEIGEINLKDPNQKMTLYLDLKLRKFKEG
ncbi:PucR family transcriptional regulator [Bacillus pakistanensis]|nr:helix-turn-helix domain-containing protein [Bacillus pakistanensis]